jgi:hypothetical protein
MRVPRFAFFVSYLYVAPVPRAPTPPKTVAPVGTCLDPIGDRGPEGRAISPLPAKAGQAPSRARAKSPFDHIRAPRPILCSLAQLPMVCQAGGFCSTGVPTGGDAPKRRGRRPRVQSKPVTPSAAKGPGFFARPAPKGAPADAALDPGRRAPCKNTFYEGEAPSRSAGESGVPLLSLWSARNPHCMRSGGP